LEVVAMAAPHATYPAQLKPPGNPPAALWRALVEPSRRITDPAQRRNAGLLAVFLLCLFGLFLSINLAYLFTIPNYHLPAADLIGYGVLAVTYVLSRSRFTRTAQMILLLMFPLNVFQNVLQGTSLNLAVTLAFLLPSFILASIFLTPLQTGAYGLVINFIVLALPFIAPGQVRGTQAVIGPFSVGVVVVTLSIIAMINRDRIERDRRQELKTDYDRTLEGWARALELRDSQTEDHSRRVINLTLRLARAYGVGEAELEYYYRGALLHDIGKMAVPDEILFKRTPLSPAQWKVMRSHPKVAAEMLSSIPFLEPALSIPVFHHEWWNGRGYPSGLRGEQIPLPARIFAVVDVWDALLSSRPYRKPWTRRKAAEYLKLNRGKQFDPKVVDVFFTLEL
jgi:putative nucleotidyltransferase with HDIG domain